MRIRPILRPTCWLTIATLSVLLSGCFDENVKNKHDMASRDTSSSEMPDWVVSPPKDSSHLYGVGSAPRIDNIALSFTRAEQNANAQIAQQLRTQVSQISSQDTQVSKSTGKSEQVTQVQSAYTQVTTTPIELKHAINEARYAGSDYVYALQSINRTRIIANLNDTINELDQSIRQHASQLSTSVTDMPNAKDWGIYMQLIPLLAERQKVIADLDLYSQSRAMLSTSHQDLLALESQTNTALAHFGFDTTGSTASHALASALSSYGLTPKSGSLFRLESNTFQSSQNQNGRFYQFEEGTLTLLKADGSELGAWTVSGRGIAANKTIAEQQAKQDWANQAINAMFHWLTGHK